MLHKEDRQIRDYELLKYGRHFRPDDKGKIIVGRNKRDNEALRELATENDLVCNMADFPGPFVLVPYGNESVMSSAAALCVRYSDAPVDTEAGVICLYGNKSITIRCKATPREDSERWII